MYFKQLLTAGLVALGATSAIAVEHGDFGTSNGEVIRWHQMAPGVFHGVPANKWNSTTHGRGDDEWDIDSIVSRRSPSWEVMPLTRDLELESRNLQSACQAVIDCIRDYGGAATVTAGYNAYITVADYAANQAKEDLAEFLKTGFFANAGGVAIAGIISGQVNAATTASCSTSSSDADVIGSAVAAAVAGNPGATEVAVTVNGPSGSWTITVSAAAQGTTPTAECS